MPQDNIDRYAAPDFIPNAEDVLRCRARTTGIHEIEFDIEVSECATMCVSIAH